jgi:hypothetical protein
MPLPQIEPDAVFLNVPYDDEFQNLYLAYIAGLHCLGLQPRIASSIPGGQRRLDRILHLIQTCRYSIHDLSRVEISATPPATPRFNMPLELGLTITWAKLHPQRHTWSLWETQARRIQKSLSDLDGTDANIHGGTVEGVLSELRNAFVRKGMPPFRKMLAVHRCLEESLPDILADAGTTNLFAAGPFQALCFAALDSARLTGSVVTA